MNIEQLTDYRNLATYASIIGDYVLAEIWYPRIKEQSIKAIHVGLVDVRAADDIRIQYDFERDGWVIYQAQKFSWGFDDETCDPEWKEAAFCKAWQFEKIWGI